MGRDKNRIEDDGIKRAALYIRVSTEEQAMHGLSLTAQRETLERYVGDNGLKLVDVYADEGVTARKKYRNRTEFMRMLADVQSGKIDLILFIKLDRWFRNIADYYEVQKILDAHNVQWLATEEDYDTTTANGRLHLNIKLSIAQDESDRTSERIKFVFAEKRRRGEVTSGKAPLGYMIEDKRLKIDPATAPLAKELFSQYVALRSVKALKRWALETHGFYHTDRGFRLLLQNEKYIGKDGCCEPLIEESTFKMAQEILRQRSQRNSGIKREYIFTGLAYCAECGGRLSAYRTSRGNVHYRCTRYPNKLPCAHKKQTNERKIEEWLVKNIVDQIELYNLKLGSEPRRPRPDTAKIRRKMEMLKDLYINDLIDRDIYERDFLALRDELNAPIEEEKRPIDVQAVMQSMSAYHKLRTAEKREFWSRIVLKISITNEEDFLLTPR